MRKSVNTFHDALMPFAERQIIDMSIRERGKEKKWKSTKDKPCKIYIFTEGDTEKIYLKHYNNKKKGVEVISVDPKHTDAVGIVRYAQKYIDEHDVDVDLGDRCYCVFDSDPKSNTNIGEAFKLIHEYRNKGLKCIFSNPSFEIWFILHYRKAPYGKNAAEVKRMVKKLVKDKAPKYKETTDIFDILIDKQEKALEEARLLHKEQMEKYKNVFSHDCNPYTNIFEFITFIKNVKKDIK